MTKQTPLELRALYSEKAEKRELMVAIVRAHEAMTGEGVRPSSLIEAFMSATNADKREAEHVFHTLVEPINPGLDFDKDFKLRTLKPGQYLTYWP